MFEGIGFSDVATYINSGNVVFSSALQDKAETIRRCEAAIADTFCINIAVTVVTMKALEDALAHAPIWWDEDKTAINYAIFVIAPTRVEDVYAGAGAIKPDYEKAAHHGDVIFWTVPRVLFAKAQWSKIASSSVNNCVTIRTANTIKKLLALGE